MEHIAIFNPAGLIFIALLIIPHVIFKIKEYTEKYIKATPCPVLSVIEAISRNICVFAMIINIPGLCLGFPSDFWTIVYYDFNGACLIAYCITWHTCTDKFSIKRAIFITVLSFLVFFGSGFFIRYYILLIASIVYLISHIMLCFHNYKNL